MRPGALAEHLRIAPRSATEVVDDLQERGLVERAPDPADRRATLVRLTEAGAAAGTDDPGRPPGRGRALLRVAERQTTAPTSPAS